MSEITPELEGVVERVQKLLRLAAKNPNEAEAASATAKAMELLAAYNLDMAAVEQAGDKSGRRAEENLKGGRYKWERDLWKAISHLNFCLYWSQIAFVEDEKAPRKWWRQREGSPRYTWVSGRNEHQHRIVGRTVNVAATKAMAGYLMAAIDRIVRERCASGRISLRDPWAISFREGVTDRLVGRIYARRAELLAEEERKKMEAEIAAQEGGRDGVSTSTALTLSTYVDQEYDANVDFVFGEGTSARWASQRARQAEAKRQAEEEYTRWAAANPEAARKEEAKRKARAEREAERNRKKNTRYTNDLSAYYSGRDAADSISLDPQAEGTKIAGVLR